MSGLVILLLLFLPSEGSCVRSDIDTTEIGWVDLETSHSAAAAGEASRAFRDPANGRIRVPDRVEWAKAMPEGPDVKSVARQKVVEEVVAAPPGGFRVRLGKGFGSAVVFRRHEAGSDFACRRGSEETFAGVVGDGTQGGGR